MVLDRELRFVTANDAYLSILLLSRVITRLGGVAPVSAEMVGRLFSAEFV